MGADAIFLSIAGKMTTGSSIYSTLTHHFISENENRKLQK